MRWVKKSLNLPISGTGFDATKILIITETRLISVGYKQWLQVSPAF